MQKDIRGYIHVELSAVLLTWRMRASDEEEEALGTSESTSHGCCVCLPQSLVVIGSRPPDSL